LQIILTTIRYSAVQFLFFDTFSWAVFILSIFAYPLPNFIERASDIHVEKFKQNWARVLVIKPGLFRYRFLYYLVLCVVLLPFVISSVINPPYKIYAVFLYYLACCALLFIEIRSL